MIPTTTSVCCGTGCRISTTGRAKEARPDPSELARRLSQWELHSDFDVFYGAAARYAKILGAKGMKVYREVTEADTLLGEVRDAKGRGHRLYSAVEEILQRASRAVEKWNTGPHSPMFPWLSRARTFQ
jgi:hypothetical protein